MDVDFQYDPWGRLREVHSFSGKTSPEARGLSRVLCLYLIGQRMMFPGLATPRTRLIILHSRSDIFKKKLLSYIAHFPETRTILSYGSGTRACLCWGRLLDDRLWWKRLAGQEMLCSSYRLCHRTRWRYLKLVSRRKTSLASRVVGWAHVDPAGF